MLWSALLELPVIGAVLRRGLLVGKKARRQHESRLFTPLVFALLLVASEIILRRAPWYAARAKCNLLLKLNCNQGCSACAGAAHGAAAATTACALHRPRQVAKRFALPSRLAKVLHCSESIIGISQAMHDACPVAQACKGSLFVEHVLLVQAFLFKNIQAEVPATAACKTFLLLRDTALWPGKPAVSSRLHSHSKPHAVASSCRSYLTFCLPSQKRGRRNLLMFRTKRTQEGRALQVVPAQEQHLGWPRSHHRVNHRWLGPAKLRPGAVSWPR